MKIVNESAWTKWRENNTDPYGKCCVDYAEAWATEMEAKLAADAKLAVADIAKVTSHEVDQRPSFGITGFMYGAAVQILAQCWERGEEMRRWHNREYGRPDLDDTPGASVNPAVLTIGLDS